MIQIGDRVRVFADLDPDNYENIGWSEEMHDLCGEEGEVTKECDYDGDEAYRVDFDSDYWWIRPEDLELVYRRASLNKFFEL